MTPRDFFTVGKKYLRTRQDGKTAVVKCITIASPFVTFESTMPARRIGKRQVPEQRVETVLICPPSRYAHFNEWSVLGDKLTCVLRTVATKDKPSVADVVLTYEAMQ